MKDIPNNQTEAPLRHYRELYKELDPEEVCRRTGAEFSGFGNHFIIEILGHKLHAKWPEFELVAEKPDCPKALLNTAMCILVIRYLIRGEQTAWRGGLLSYRELPWGDVYDSNFNGRCRLRLAYGFGNDPDGFVRSAERLGGTVSAKRAGSVTADLPLSGGVTVRIILHEGDDEFPPASQILFSDNVSSVWDAEDLAGMGEVIISALKEVRE